MAQALKALLRHDAQLLLDGSEALPKLLRHVDVGLWSAMATNAPPALRLAFLDAQEPLPFKSLGWMRMGCVRAMVGGFHGGFQRLAPKLK